MKDTYKSIYNDFSEGAKNTFYLNIISINFKNLLQNNYCNVHRLSGSRDLF